MQTASRHTDGEMDPQQGVMELQYVTISRPVVCAYLYTFSVRSISIVPRKEVADAWICAVYYCLPIMWRLRLLGLLSWCGWRRSLARAPCRTTPHGGARSARIR